MIVSFHKLHVWNRGKEYYHFHVGSFHFHGEMRKIQSFWPAWGRRWSTWQGSFLRYVFIVSYKLTDVQPPRWQGRPWQCPGHGFEPWRYLLHFFQLQFWHFWQYGLGFWALAFFANILLPACLQHPWPIILFFIFIFILLY